jgi:hypothetical protein
VRAQGKTEAEIAKFSALFAEIQQQIDTKQLRPMVRTQYTRTAFQIPFDSTVRISLDTNLTMIKENPDDGPTCTVAGRRALPHAPCMRSISLPTLRHRPCTAWFISTSGDSTGCVGLYGLCGAQEPAWWLVLRCPYLRTHGLFAQGWHWVMHDPHATVPWHHG